MTTLRTIGNSQGIIIPNILIKKANLDGHELSLEITKEGLLIKPLGKPRETWKAAIETALAKHEHDVDHEWLDADLIEDNENNDDQ